MKLQKTLLSTVAALVASAGIALAISGNQIGFPVVNGPSYCGSTGNNGVCNLTVPAGPAPTGNETILANTNLANGANPQTVLLNMATMGALPYQYVAAPPPAGSTTLVSTVGTLVLDPTTTIATYTVTFPAASTLTDGQYLRITSSKTITAVTLTAGTGSAISNAPPAINATNSIALVGYEFVYVAPVTTWFRVQ
jgi:hypothetical protein